MKKLTVLGVILVLIMLLSSCSDINTKSTSTTNRLQQSTNWHLSADWQVHPSFKYDVLCFLNSLTGDPFYLKYYQDEYAKFEPKLTPAARKAIAGLRKWKEQNKKIISAFLTLYFSATDDETLDDMLATLDNSKTMQRNLKATPYYNFFSWLFHYNPIRDELKIIFLFLKDIGFESYWKENIRPQVLKKIAKIGPELHNYNVITEVEQFLGHPLASNQITVYLLYYTQPHGMKITGTRFITDVSYPVSIVVSNAVHEMMHPPYDFDGDKELRTALNRLKKDAFLMDKVSNHNPSFGYNSFEGYIEENVVRALDQIINERLGIAKDARKRWKEDDEGMHVFAAALYHTMKEEKYNQKNLRLRDFLINMINTGKLGPGQIEKVYNNFYSTD